MSKKLVHVALTGSRKSGKDGVAKLFRQLGVPVFEADAVLKYILNYRDDVVASVRKHFGNEYIIGDYINPMAFDTDQKFDDLLNLVEFDLFEAYSKFNKNNSDKSYTIFHSSLIFERNWRSKFDYTITVFTPKEDRMYRYRIETGDSVKVVDTLFSKEMPDLSKNTLSDYIIHNYDGCPDIVKQVTNIDQQLVDNCIKRNKPVFVM